MIIKNSSKRGGFAVGTNTVTDEKLAAGGIAALSMLIIAAIANSKTSDKKKRRRKRTARILSFPLLYKLSKAAVSQVKLHSLTNRVKNGEDICTGNLSDSIFRGIEVIQAEPISSEAEVYDIVSNGGESDEKV